MPQDIAISRSGGGYASTEILFPNMSVCITPTNTNEHRLLPPEFWDNTLSVTFIENSSLQGTDMFCLLISNLCHFLCLSEECCILRTNYSGRHPVPCECSEMHCSHCCSELKITEHRRTQQSSEGSHVTPPCCLFISAQLR